MSTPARTSARAQSPGERRREQGESHSGRLLLRMPPDLHGELARRAEREGVSLNQFISGTLASAVGWRTGSADAEEKADAGPPPDGAGSRRSRLFFTALVANFVVLAVASIAAVALLVYAWRT